MKKTKHKQNQQICIKYSLLNVLLITTALLLFLNTVSFDFIRFSDDIETDLKINVDEKENKQNSNVFINMNEIDKGINDINSFKFVLIEYNGELFVQSCKLEVATTCLHPHAFKDFTQTHRREENTVLGGGRITIYSEDLNILVFGYSKTYRKKLRTTYKKKTNLITCKLIKEAFPQFSVKWSSEGYNAGDEYEIPFKLC